MGQTCLHLLARFEMRYDLNWTPIISINYYLFKPWFEGEILLVFLAFIYSHYVSTAIRLDISENTAIRDKKRGHDRRRNNVTWKILFYPLSTGWDCKTVRIFEYSSTREQSKKWSGSEAVNGQAARDSSATQNRLWENKNRQFCRLALVEKVVKSLR